MCLEYGTAFGGGAGRHHSTISLLLLPQSSVFPPHPRCTLHIFLFRGEPVTLLMRCPQGRPRKGLGSGRPSPGLRTCSRTSQPPLHVRNIWGALNNANSWAIATQTSWSTTNILPFRGTGSEAPGVRSRLMVARWANAEAASEPRQSVLESKLRILHLVVSPLQAELKED